VQGIVRAITKRNECGNETFILCPDDGLTYQRWIEVISEELGRAKPFLHLPFPVVKFATALLAPVMNRGKQRTFMYQASTGPLISLSSLASAHFHSPRPLVHKSHTHTHAATAPSVHSNAHG
jgi:hypothetical protein